MPPGQGYTGHAFNDANHCDATTMLGEVSHNLNEAGKDRVAGIAVGNRLGPGIEVASLPELGEGGSWSTCTNGCNLDPPRDVAHVQFRSRIAFKLVWCPPTFETFVLVDDDGALLATGCPTGPGLPDARQRVANYGLVRGSKYAVAADKANEDAWRSRVAEVEEKLHAAEARAAPHRNSARRDAGLRLDRRTEVGAASSRLAQPGPPRLLGAAQAPRAVGVCVPPPTCD